MMSRRNGSCWKELREELLVNSETSAEYERLRRRYEFINQVIGARIEKGLTQAQLAEKVGTRQANISRLERGDSNPTVEFLQKIAEGLGKELIIQIK